MFKNILFFIKQLRIIFNQIILFFRIKNNFFFQLVTLQLFFFVIHILSSLCQVYLRNALILYNNAEYRDEKFVIQNQNVSKKKNFRNNFFFNPYLLIAVQQNISI